MTYREYRWYMKNFFEKYYAKLSRDEINITLPMGERDRQMWAEDADPGREWKKWRLVPAEIGEGEIAALEENIGAKLPLCLKAFLTAYHHFFEPPIGRNPVSRHFQGFLEAYNPALVRRGYLPFAWDDEGYFIRCIRLGNMPKEEECRVCEIDHEVLFDFDEDAVTPQEIGENMRPVAPNFLAFLEDILTGRDPRSLKKAAKQAVKDILKKGLKIPDYDSLMDKMEQDPDAVYNALIPVQEEYSLTDEEIDDMLDLLEYSWD